MEHNIKIYSFYYKNCAVPVANDLYQPIMAGNALQKDQPVMIGDDSGDSISEKNPYFSELTGIYWVWKNRKHEITGSCHYRRYFSAREEPFDFKIKRLLYYPVGLYRKRFGLIYTGNIQRFRERMLNREEIIEIFQSYDAILPQKRKLNYSVRKHYERYHNTHDLPIVENILRNQYPGYLPAFYQVMDGNRLYANNMFVLEEARFNDFMSWLFTILFELEKQLNLSDYKGYQQRIFGFLGERLLTIWFFHQNLKVKELPVIYFKQLKSYNL